MDLSELNTLIGYFGALGIGGMIGGGIMWFFVKSYIPSYLEEKGKNQATKEDIGGITREVESIKNSFAIQLKELEHQKTLLAEGFKSSLSQQQEYVRTANAAVVELTRKLAAGSHLISWLSWGATEPAVVLSEKDFSEYNKGMIKVMGDLVGLQATVAALDPAKHAALSRFADQLYERDINVSKARVLYRADDSEKKRESIELLKSIYQASIEFDDALLAEVTGLLVVAPPS
jgi:hypothetical protein